MQLLASYCCSCRRYGVPHGPEDRKDSKSEYWWRTYQITWPRQVQFFDTFLHLPNLSETLRAKILLDLQRYNWWEEASSGVSNGYPTTKFAFPITTGMAFNRTLWQLTGRQVSARGSYSDNYRSHRNKRLQMFLLYNARYADRS